ncbi:MAG: 6-phosphogluconolactonase [Clostridia bacterium]|jgi:6-phosphogluconolactonase
MMDIRIFQGADNWIQGITEDFIQAMAAVPASRPPRLCLAGGQTPEPVYRVLSQRMVAGRIGRIPAILVPGDERVPGGEQGSTGNPSYLNETMLKRSFAQALAAGVAVLYSWFDETARWPAGGSGFDLAQSMIQTMEARLRSLAAPDQALFDLCYLGLGADGHTAGLFPGMPGLTDQSLCVRGLAPMPPTQRVSLGFPALLSSRRTRFLISAKGKEDALARLQAGDASCPAVMAATTDTVAFVLA